MKITLTKKNIVLLVLLSFLVVLLGFSFAYFVGGVGTPAITDTSITGDKTSRLIFTPGNPISLVASLDNFTDGAGSLSGETTSTATLTSSSTQEVVNDTYNVYYNITENNYIYTVNESTPELILEIFDNEGNEITSLDGLTYVTTTDALTGETINGFDVTTYTGLVTVKEDTPISATHPDNTIHEWNVKLTYLNLDADQSLNEGKTFDGEFILNEVKIGFYYDLINIESSGDSLIQHTESLEHSAQDNNYRYSGINPNNWVCLSEVISTCNSDDLYRIVGIYENRVKLMKNTTNISFRYDQLSSAYDALNNTFYNSLSEKIRNSIEAEVFTTASIVTSLYDAKQYYDVENSSYSTEAYNVVSITGSDFLFASDQSSWGVMNNEGSENVVNKTTNWIYTSNFHQRFLNMDYIIISSNANINFAWYHDAWFVRPVFYLKEEVKLAQGTGTLSDPYFIKL